MPLTVVGMAAKAAPERSATAEIAALMKDLEPMRNSSCGLKGLKKAEKAGRKFYRKHTKTNAVNIPPKAFFRFPFFGFLLVLFIHSTGVK
jgi:hypothetical protein